MSDPDDPRAAATPYMRRLAASMRRSRETIRTLPGQLSRSLAPASRSRHRRRDLLLLLAAVVPFAIAMAVVGARRGHGSWLVAEVSPPPWLSGSGPGRSRLRELVGQSVAFEHGRVRAPAPLGCEGARYREIELPPAGLFQGVLAGRADIASQVGRLGINGDVIETLRVDCDNASFDYHRVGDSLVTLVDGMLLRLGSKKP